MDIQGNALAAALAFDGLQTARVELEQVGDLIVRLAGRGRGESSGPNGGTTDAGRGGDKFQQIEGYVFVTASGAGQCGGLLHLRPPMAMLTDRVLAAGADAPVASVVGFAPLGRSLLALWLTRRVHTASLHFSGLAARGGLGRDDGGVAWHSKR